MIDNGVLSTCVAARGPLPFGRLFHSAVAELRRRTDGVIHCQADAGVIGDGVSTCYTDIGGNADVLFGEAIEIHGSGEVLPDNESPDSHAAIPVLPSAYAVVMILTTPLEVPDDATRGALHAHAVVKLTEELDEQDIPWSWCSDLGGGPYGGFHDWSDDLEHLDRLGDALAWGAVSS